MAPIVETIEIARPPDEVFAYMTNPSRQPEWQESLVSSRVEGGGTPTVGSRVMQTRRVGGRERTMTMEVTELDPPTSFAFRGIDGPVRATGRGSIQPLEDGRRSRVTIQLDFEGHGIGKLLVPLMVRREATKELPRNQQMLKEHLEGSGTQDEPPTAG
jgi:uncharacterized protein YndB with AHSA1/START domain